MAAMPAFFDSLPASELPRWLRYYCRLGYEVALSCRGPEDPAPRCQRLAARRQALRQAVRHQLAQHYQLDEAQTQRLFAQWSRHMFSQLLARDGMRALNLEAALTDSLLP